MRAQGFYPSDVPQFLRENIKGKKIGNSVGAVVPHAGYVFSGAVAGKVYGSLNIDKKRIIVLGPNHWGEETFIDTGKWSTPLGEAALDNDFIDKLGFEQHDSREHSIEVNIPFLQHLLGDFKLVPIVVGGMSFKDVERFAEQIQDENSFYIASSDFTHYGPNFNHMPAGPANVSWVEKTDKGLIDLICEMKAHEFYNEVVEQGHTVCGYIPITALMLILNNMFNAYGQMIDYRTSYGINPAASFVGYGGIVFRAKGSD